MKKKIDIARAMLDLADRCTIQELEEWKAQIPVVAEERGLDVNGLGARIVIEAIDAAIKAKQGQQADGVSAI